LHPNEKVVLDEISTLVIGYAEGFGGDLGVTVDFYELPMFYIGSDGVAVLATRDEAIAFVEDVLARVRPLGFSHTTVDSCQVRMLKATVALCALEGTRRKKDGSELEHIGATYVVTAHPEWKIRELIATDPGRSGASVI
jgi:hypothetical protein